MCFVRFPSLCVERCVEGGSGVRRRSSKTTNGGGLTPRTNPPESNPGVKKHVAQFMDMAGLAYTACKQHGISGAGIAGPHWAEPGTAPVRETRPNIIPSRLPYPSNRGYSMGFSKCFSMGPDP